MLTETETIGPAAIEVGVLKKLGRPTDFHKIKASHLFDNCWRVNVWRTHGTGIVPITNLTDSFFIRASGVDFCASIPRRY